MLMTIFILKGKEMWKAKIVNNIRFVSTLDLSPLSTSDLLPKHRTSNFSWNIRYDVETSKVANTCASVLWFIRCWPMVVCHIWYVWSWLHWLKHFHFLRDSRIREVSQTLQFLLQDAQDRVHSVFTA